tara:strand:- start:798 stop:1295 length:498 start_codon:yes stop_codon:yes gene_type:complete
MNLRSIILGPVLAATLYSGNIQAENVGYANIGTSSNAKNPVNGSFGAKFIKKLGNGFDIGLDLGLLLENTSYETSMGAILGKDFKDYGLNIGAGANMIQLREPMQALESEETTQEGSAFIRTSLYRKIKDKLRLSLNYQKNFASDTLYEVGYPHHRASIGIETPF